MSPPFVLADNVNRLRRLLGMTQEQLARRAGMRQPRIAEIERADANPTLETLARLARALGLTLPVLLEEQTEEAQEPSSGSGASD